MKMDMKKWVSETIASPKKKAMPILSFPGIQMTGHTVEELVKDGKLQALCMEKIANRFPAGAAFSLMDLSVEAEAFGSAVRYSQNEVPTVTEILIHNEAEAEALQIPMVGQGRTEECLKGIEEACDKITDRPVLAGMIGPYSLAGRLLGMTEIMILCYEEPELVECVLRKATQFLVAYGRAFREMGANGIVLAEPAAGLLSPGLCRKFSTPYVCKIKEELRDQNFLFMYHNCGNVIPLLEDLAEIGADAYSLGNAVDIKQVLENIPGEYIVAGNLDPAGILRSGTPESIREETLKLLEQCGIYHNFVISSGCDIPPMTPLDNIQAFFGAVDEFYGQ